MSGFSKEIKMPDGSTYTVKKLLSRINVKLEKSNTANMGYMSTGLSLAPHNTSGFNVCASASHGCIQGCLYTSGYAMIHPRTIFPPRIAKTIFFHKHREEFKHRLTEEIFFARRMANRKGLKLAIRLNVFSDIMWERHISHIMQTFNDVQFYDYTKHYSRMVKFLKRELPENYYLTFSWSGENASQCDSIRELGGNVAIPFHKKIPLTFNGNLVLDGDKTDLRFLDPQGDGYIIGLKAKGKARKDYDSGFIQVA